jgi:transposase
VERLGDVALILSALNLDDIETAAWEPYHREGAGRPPRNPVGIFKALIVKRLRQIPSDRELYRRLWDDPILREICDIEDREKPYHPSQLTRFRRRVGPERLEGIVKDLVEELLEGGVIDGETVAIDATFIEAYSRRDPHDDRRGYSDPDARVGRDGRSYGNGLVEEYRCEDAKGVLISMGSMTGTARVIVDKMREEGKPIGLVKLRTFRHFPTEDIREIGEEVEAIGFVDRNFSHGVAGGGGIGTIETSRALYHLDERPPLIGFIAGIGGRNVTLDNFRYMAEKVLKVAETKKVEKEVEWIGLSA